MYNNKLAAAILVDGRVLREHSGDTVYLPFGAEYEIRLKNLDASRRACAKIYIDGTLATQSGVIIRPNQTLDLERYIGDCLDQGNRFKFIERTERIEQHRGIDVEDGLIRIEFQFEAEPRANFGSWHSTPWHATQPYDGRRNVWRGASYTKGAGGTDCDHYSATNITCSTAATNSASVNDAGITVPGSISSQSFGQVYDFVPVSPTYSMVLRLLGKTVNTPVSKPVTVKTKPKCVTCGHTNRSGAKFCSECGTGLALVA